MPRLSSLARPRKVSAAIRRRWFEKQMDRIPIDHYRLVDLGTEWGGGWVVPDDLIEESSVCYCVGAGSDVSFDLALIERYGAQVRCIDPFNVFREQAEARAAGDPRFTFHEVALAAEDGPLDMYGAEDPESGSLSAANLYGTEAVKTMPGRSLPSLMQELGDDKIDLLKLDIEGSEYEVLPTLNLRAIGVRVLCVELHPSESVKGARELIAAIRAQGYRLIHCKHPASYTFVRGTEGG